MKTAVLLVLLPLSLLSAPPRAQQPQPTAPGSDETLLRLYDIRDLHTQPELLDDAPAEERAARERAMEADYARIADTLLELLRENMGPLDESREQLLAAPGGTLVGSLTAAQHAFAKDFLSYQREVRGALYHVEVRIATLPDDAYEELELGEPQKVLHDLELAIVLRIVERREGEMLSAPSLMIAPRQRAEIAAVDQISYVKDWEIHEHVEPGDQTILVPVIGVLEEGVRLTARVVPLVEGRAMVDLSVTQSEVVRPIPTIVTRLGIEGSPTVTLALPETVKREIETRAVLGDGETALVSAGHPRDGERTLVLARVRRYDQEERSDHPPDGAERRDH